MKNIDERIAIEFLGWKKEGNHYFDSCGHPRYEIPPYSKDDNLALGLLKTFRKRYDFCCINIKSDYHYCWDASLIPGFHYRSLDDDKHEPVVFVTQEEFAPLICFMILKGIEWVSSQCK